MLEASYLGKVCAEMLCSGSFQDADDSVSIKLASTYLRTTILRPMATSDGESCERRPRTAALELSPLVGTSGMSFRQLVTAGRTGLEDETGAGGSVDERSLQRTHEDALRLFGEVGFSGTFWHRCGLCCVRWT